MSTEIDWDTYEPTAAVRKAAILLSSADTVDATCFGWVPQAREALATALDVEEMACALYISDHPYDTAEQWRDHGSERAKDIYRTLARAIRTALLGGAS